MIESIKEINFPQYATLSQATVVLNDMGDRTITADVTIDGAVAPDFSYDWEVEFKGERYIQPLRKPQALKDNQSLKSTISLTFYHWAIYQLKRDFFVELASTQAGTAFADKYIVPLAVNLGEFVIAFNKVLSYYFPNGEIYAKLNPDWQYDQDKQYVDISYSYMWDVLQKTYDMFGVRWTIERDAYGKYAIRFGYPAKELTHIFEYGFDGGLLKVERQVQSVNIRNKILGRGGSQNIPYLYFKNYDKYPQGGDGNQGMMPDPDAIPELTNIYFSELRDSNFRSYIQGWKTNSHRRLVEGDRLENFDATRAKSDYAYMRGATDSKFDPVEYVKDDASIEEYGVLVGKIDNNEDIFPSIQGMDIEIETPDGNTLFTRADEIVAVQEVMTDHVASEDGTIKDDINLEAKSETEHGAGKNSFTAEAATITVSSNEITIPEGYEGTLFDDPTVKYTLEFKERIKQYMQYNPYYEGDKISRVQYSEDDDEFPSVSYKVIDVISDREVEPINLPEGKYRLDYTLSFPEVTLKKGIVHYEQTPSGLGQTERLSVHWLKRIVTASATIVCKSFYGDVILNKVDGAPISKSVSVGANSKATISISGDTFTVPAQGALMVDVPISITPKETTTFSEKTVKVVNTITNEIVPASNIPQGQYKLLVEVALTNESNSSKTLRVELLPAYLYFIENTQKWEPTFDVWIKNIFNTKKSDYPSDEAYVEGVWSPLKTEEEMALTFSSGNLSGHDGWEFRVKKGGIAYDNSKTIIDTRGNQVRSEWRLTLIKSDAELETMRKYIPYKDFNANAGDMFFFTGISLPHQYVLSAEKKLTSYKLDNLAEVKDIKPQWVVSLDKVRAYSEQTERLIDALSVGSIITLKDKRFTKHIGEKQILQSITYDWQENSLLPNVDVVLSDKVTTSLSTVAMLQGKVDSLAKSVGELSNLEQIVRKIGDLLYLRKDGFEDVSFSPTMFAEKVSSKNFKPGVVGGAGWGFYQDAYGQSIIEADKLFIRNEMQVNDFIVNQVEARGGLEILSAANITISSIEPITLEDETIGERCFFDTKAASKANLFVVDDIAYCNRFDSKNTQLKYYRRKVVEIGENYITLSTTEVDGEGAPQVGDVVVQYGNYTDKARQCVIIRDVVNGGYEKMIRDLDSVTSNGIEYYFAGKFAEGDPRWFVGDSQQHVEYKDGELIIKGILKATAGSDINIGNQNMLRNSGFTGDYLSEPLADERVMQAADEMFSDPFDHWSKGDNVVIVELPNNAASGYGVQFPENPDEDLSQELYYPVLGGESYMLSFKAKGALLSSVTDEETGEEINTYNSLFYTIGGETKEVHLTDKWERYIEKITVGETSKDFIITASSVTLCEIQLERGTVATAWRTSPLDNNSDRVYIQSIDYLANSLVEEAIEGETDVLGGLVLTNHIKVGELDEDNKFKEKAGINGVYNNDDSPAFWAGGDFDTAIATAKKYETNTTTPQGEVPFVVTHSGKVVLNDAIVRGVVYASGGEFSGSIKLKFQEITAGERHTYKHADSSSVWLSPGEDAPTTLVLPDLDELDGILLNVMCYPKIVQKQHDGVIEGRKILCPQINETVGPYYVSEIQLNGGGFLQLTYNKAKREWILVNISAKDPEFIIYKEN